MKCVRDLSQILDQDDQQKALEDWNEALEEVLVLGREDPLVVVDQEAGGEDHGAADEAVKQVVTYHADRFFYHTNSRFLALKRKFRLNLELGEKDCPKS